MTHRRSPATRSLIGLSLCSLVAMFSGASGDDTNLSERAERLLKERCGDCHSGVQAKGGLRLDSLEEISRGNKRGAVVVGGQPGRSLLLEVVLNNKMPPDDPLPESERLLLKEWIHQGAAGLTKAERRHWAFQSVVRPETPRVAGVPIRTPIDAFLGEQLTRRGLTFSTEASRVILIRRVCFDLTGLPPALSEIDAFVSDSTPDAYEAMVDRYLESPRYAERWGKFWLDVAGYADSNGHFNADTNRPLAYWYRDYVIESIGRDKPYDQFVREQLAGDELAGYVHEGDFTAEMAERLTATQFLRNGQDGTSESDGNADEVLADKFAVIEGNLQIAMNGLLGLTIQCARCHSHKFEPVSHEEYYQLQAILIPAYLPEKWIKSNDRTATLGLRAERDRNTEQAKLVDEQVSALKSSRDQALASLKEALIVERLGSLPTGRATEILDANRVAAAKQTREQKRLAAENAKALAVTDEELQKRFPEAKSLKEQFDQLITVREQQRPAAPAQYSILADVTASPPPHHLLVRGNYKTPGIEVSPGVPAALTPPGNAFTIPDDANRKSSGRRLAFSRWMTSPQNPLFARVMVNRVWQHHFGTGIVDPPDNLGQSGAAPSHPELLDFLADEFVRQGWSLKALHRLMLRSAAYRQGDGRDSEEKGEGIDPENRLLWRFPTRRLDAEAIRDAMLFVSGELDLEGGGPAVPTTRERAGSVIVEESVPGSHRRSVFLQQRRTQVLTFLELFDAPPILTTCGFRTQSTAPLQSLTLMNSEFVRLRSEAFAKRVLTTTQSTARIETAFRIACGRSPNPDERMAAQTFLESPRDSKSDSEVARWTDFCQMLLASNGFLYVD